MGVSLEERPVHEGPGVALVGVDDHILDRSQAHCGTLPTFCPPENRRRPCPAGWIF